MEVLHAPENIAGQARMISRAHYLKPLLVVNHTFGTLLQKSQLTHSGMESQFPDKCKFLIL